MKKYISIISYFSLSLYAIMNCEFLATIKSAAILGVEGSSLTYAVYSVAVALGVALFYFCKKYAKTGSRKKTALVTVFCAAIFCVLLLALSGTAPLFWVSLAGLFLLAGFNTGIVSFLLYRAYQARQPIGRILALSSLAGLGLHYLASLLFSVAAFPGIAVFCATAPAIAALLCLLVAKLRSRLDESAENNMQRQNGRKKYTAMLVMIGMVVAVLSFFIGINDSLVAQRLVFHISATDFFYPVLFYIPGQVLACLILDVQKGRFLHIATLASVVLLIPATLFLESPDEFYMNSGINYFAGGFFLAYIMTGFISVAARARNRLLVVCISGILYPAFCGVGGLLSPYISGSMDTYMALTGFSLLVVLLVVTAWLSQSFYNPGNGAAALSGSIAFSATQFDTEQAARDLKLTTREREILPYLLGSMTADEIARELYISSSTLKTHTRNILGKANAASRRELRKLLL